jgi:hypothetical protein
MEFKDAIALVGLIGAVVGLFFTGIQVRRSYRTERGKFFKDLYSPFFSDEQIRYVYELIEEGGFSFQEGFGASTDEERLRRQNTVEKLFAQFEMISSLFYRKLLSQGDMVHFDYNIQRICLTRGFDGYLAMLEKWQKLRGLTQGPYSSFQRYVRENSSRLCKRA